VGKVETMNREVRATVAGPYLAPIEGATSTALPTGFSEQDGAFCAVFNKSTPATDRSDLFKKEIRSEGI
jgi:hypothetical protein